MAQTLDIKRYPESLQKLAQALEQKQEIRIELASRKDAQHMRFQFYGFRKAATIAGLNNLYPKLQGVVVSIEDSTIIFRQAESQDFSRAIDAALEGIEIGQLPTPTEPRETADETGVTQSALINEFLHSGDKP